MENHEGTKTNAFAIITFLLGMLELPLYFFVVKFSMSNRIKTEYLFVFWPLIAIALLFLSIAALVQVNKKNEKGKGLAISAVVLTSLGTVGSILPIMLLLLYGMLG